MSRENATKEDIKKLKKQLQHLNERIDHYENQSDYNADGYLEVISKINALQLKKQAVEDSLGRILKKSFSKDLPEVLPVSVPNYLKK